MSEKVRALSPLGKTWIFDLDGTVVKHNGHKIGGSDTLLEGAREFFAKIPDEDMIVFITSRNQEHKNATEMFLKGCGIRFEAIIFNAPYGERILVNDAKPSGLKTAIAVNTVRDIFMTEGFVIDAEL